MTPPACLALVLSSRLPALTAGPHSITGVTGRSATLTAASKCECIRRRIELELFDGLKTRAVAVLENQRRRSRRAWLGGRTFYFIEGAVHRPGRGFVRNAERERQRLRAPEVARNQLEGLALLVAIVLETPALERARRGS